ncbi:MAG: enoyl-CoA hydratase-related protein [Burkholderiaceae bacterium]
MADHVLAEVRDGVGIATLNRPAARNALNRALIAELDAVLRAFDGDPAIGAIVLTGGGEMFCAGADIKEMTDKNFAQAYLEDFVTRDWLALDECRKPLIAAVAGNALGGGCEFALMCDIVVADPTARFGQTEVLVGTIPGGGGTQRLARSVGKAKAMELCLTGRIIDAREAERIGIVSLLAEPGEHIERAVEIGRRIAACSRPIIYMIKESVRAAFETPLREGLHLERRLLHATFALQDQKEAMKAFAEKRKPVFRHE